MAHKTLKPKDLRRKDAQKLDELEDMLNSGDEEAIEAGYEQIVAFTSRNPRLIDGWYIAQQYASHYYDPYLAWEASSHLYMLAPDDEMNVFNIAAAAVQLQVVYTAQHYLEQYVEQYPQGQYADSARELQPTINEMVEQNYVAHPEMRAVGLEAKLLYEEAIVHLRQDKPLEARVAIRKALKLMPDVSIPHEILALTYSVTGSLERALNLSQRALADFPDSIILKSYVVTHLIRLGRQDEAQSHLADLEEIAPGTPATGWMSAIEALAMAGRYEALITLHNQISTREDVKVTSLPPVTLNHIAAAYVICDDVDTGRAIWESLIEDNTDYALLTENIVNLEMPVSQRNGPAHFETWHLFAADWNEKIAAKFERLSSQRDILHRHVYKIIDSTPGIVGSSMLLLKTGTIEGRDLALDIARHYPLPDLLDFAQGERGTDYHRWRAAYYAVQHGLHDPTQPFPLYVNGEAHTLHFPAIDITYDSSKPHGNKAVQRIIEKAYDLLQTKEADDAHEALALLEEGLEQAPNYAILHQYKWTCYKILGEDDKARAATLLLAEQHPDYFFSRTQMAEDAIVKENLDEAREWLAPLLDKQQLHVSEFRALANTQILLAQAEDNTVNARHWVNLWQESEPGEVPLQYRLIGLDLDADNPLITLRALSSYMSLEERESFAELLNEMTPQGARSGQGLIDDLQDDFDDIWDVT